MDDKTFSVLLYTSDEPPAEVEWPVNKEHVIEQVIIGILAKRNITPSYETIFGLRVIKNRIWLSPSRPVEDVIRMVKGMSNAQGGAKLELRMRFRPAYFDRLIHEDRIALEYIFAQIRYDFLNTNFKNVERDLLILDGAVLGMIALDLVRQSNFEFHNVGKLLREVDKDKAVPKKASNWQRSLLLHYADKVNLKKSVEIGAKHYHQDSDEVRKSYIDLFVSNVVRDYGCETYRVRYSSERLSLVTYDPRSAPPDYRRSKFDRLLVRVRYYQQEAPVLIKDPDAASTSSEIEPTKTVHPKELETFCVVEAKLKSKRPPTKPNNNQYYSWNKSNWYKVCDVENISSATINDNAVRLDKAQSNSVCFHFQTQWHAESFLSCICGYFRLTKKWNFNLCRDVCSPEIDILKSLGCHGPIGLISTKAKLNAYSAPGSYLVRKCRLVRNRYFIDTILPAQTRLTIVVNYDEIFRKFTLGDSLSNRSPNIRVLSSQNSYPQLFELIRDLEIRFKLSNHLPELKQQLKNIIRPEDDDDYPALLYSTSNKNLAELESSIEGSRGTAESFMPIVIPPTLISEIEIISGICNLMSVSIGKFCQSDTVIIKREINSEAETYKNLPDYSPYTFHYCPKEHVTSLDKSGYSSMLADWLLIKSPLFANTVGCLLGDNSIIQEHFPLGPLNRFLAGNRNLSKSSRITISIQLAQALLYLREKRIVHGKIRCHNVFVSRTEPIQVKLSDPLGSLDTYQDRAFLPSEYFTTILDICVKQFTSGIDVWAFGTTLWQLFSNGERPPAGLYATYLTQPADCPNDAWDLIESCWTPIPRRPSPWALNRDLNGILAKMESESRAGKLINENTDMVHVITEMQRLTNTREDDVAALPDIPSAQGECDTPATRKDGPSPSSSDSPSSGFHEMTDVDDADVSPKQTICKQDTSEQTKFEQEPTTAISPKAEGKICNLLDKQTEGTSSIGPDQSVVVNIPAPKFNIKGVKSSITLQKDTISVSDDVMGAVWEVGLNHVKLGPEIGRGTSGTVRKGVLYDKHGSPHVVAIKCLNKLSSQLSLTDLEDLREEFAIMKSLEHKNVIKAIGHVETFSLIVFEYMALGCLMPTIRGMRRSELRRLPLEQYAHDIASGMEYLASRQIIHRDLALRNILVRNQHEIVICDFGLALVLSPSGRNSQESGHALPIKWYAPESILTGKFTHESDVWSYGVLLWEIYSGGDTPQYPGPLESLLSTLEHERLKKPLDCPPEVYSIMLKCWAHDPGQRISFTRLRKDFSYLIRCKIKNCDISNPW